MSRAAFITTALLLGVLVGSVASARADSKDKKDNKEKGHKIVGLSPVDFPPAEKGHGRWEDGDKDNHGHHGDKHHGDKHHGDKHHGDKHHGGQTEFPGGSKNGPPGTPENPTQPTPPKTPIRKFPPATLKVFGKTTAANPMKGLHNPLRPTKPAPGQITTLGSGVNGFANAVGKDVGSLVGFGVSTAIKGVGGVLTAAGDIVGGVAKGVGAVAGGVATGLGDVAGGVANGLGDVVGGIGSALGSLL